MFRPILILVASLLVAFAPAQALQLVSRAADGGFGNGRSICYGSCISSDGRYVAFESSATNLVADDTNDITDVFLRDVRKGTTERLSVAADGAQANGASLRPSISADGHYVVFWSYASNLVGDDTNGKWDIFLRDLRKGTTERLSVTSAGGQADGDKDPEIPPSISRNGRFVVWASEASNLVDGDTNGTWDVFVRDREKGTTEMVSITEKGEVGNGASIQPCISEDGSTIAFRTAATNLIPGDENQSWDILVCDRPRKTFKCATLDYHGAFGQKNQDGPTNYSPSLSGDGRYIAFDSSATDLVPEDTNARRDVFVRDLNAGRTYRISYGPSGQGNAPSNYPSISADGRMVAFESLATNLVSGDLNQHPDVFVCNLVTGAIQLISCDPTGLQGNKDSLTTRISGDGRWVVFRSEANNLLPGDRNGQCDVFILELGRQ